MMLSKSLRVGLLVLMWVLAMTGCKEDDTSTGQTVRVCYIPFSASTYAAIDRASFDKKCTDLGDMRLKDEPMRSLFEAVQKAAPVKSFDDNVVRLSIRMPDSSIVYINQDGEVIRAAQVVKISPKFIEELDKRLYKLQQRAFERQ